MRKPNKNNMYTVLDLIIMRKGYNTKSFRSTYDTPFTYFSIITAKLYCPHALLIIAQPQTHTIKRKGKKKRSSYNLILLSN